MVPEPAGRPHGVPEELPHPPSERVGVGVHEAPTNVLWDGLRKVRVPRGDIVPVRELYDERASFACRGTKDFSFSCVLPILLCRDRGVEESSEGADRVGVRVGERRFVRL